MGQLTADTPKPLLDCGGRPFLWWILRELTRFGFEDVVLLAGHKSALIDDFSAKVAAMLPRALSLKVSVEPVRAGTGGAVWHARHLLHDAFLLINGDSWLDTDLASFIAASPTENSAAASVLLCAMPDCSRYGTVELREGRILAFHEKTANSAGGLINAGIYKFEKGVMPFLSPNCSLETDVLPLLAQKRLLAGKVMDGYFIDIGIPADYARAGKELPKRLMRPELCFDRDDIFDKDASTVE
jgi:NDP-sugar pyrophosphorylase family protein